MPHQSTTPTWQDYLAHYSEGSAAVLFDAVFVEQWGPRPWQPGEAERDAARKAWFRELGKDLLPPRPKRS